MSGKVGHTHSEEKQISPEDFFTLNVYYSNGHLELFLSLPNLCVPCHVRYPGDMRVGGLGGEGGLGPHDGLACHKHSLSFIARWIRSYLGSCEPAESERRRKSWRSGSCQQPGITSSVCSFCPSNSHIDYYDPIYL